MAVDHPLVAVELRARLQQGRVRAGDLGLGHREAGANPPLQQRLQPALALLGRAVLGEDLHVAGVRGRAVEGHRRRHRAAAHLLAEQPVLPVLQPWPEALVGHEQVPEPLGLRLLADGDQVGGVGDARRDLGVQRLHHLPLLRVDLGVHEVEHALAQLCDLGAGGEVHRFLSSSCFRRRNANRIDAFQDAAVAGEELAVLLEQPGQLQPGDLGQLALEDPRRLAAAQLRRDRQEELVDQAPAWS